MRGIRHKLALLLPRSIHRMHRPAREQQADRQKDHKARRADQQAVLQQMIHGAALARGIGKDNVLPARRGKLVIAQAVFLQHAGLAARCARIRNQFLQQRAIGQVEVSPIRGEQLAAWTQSQQKIRQLHPSACRRRHAGLHRIERNRLHHIDALAFQVFLGEIQNGRKDRQQHNRYNRHIDAHKFNPQPFQHALPPPDDIPTAAPP